jgi:aminoglycoside phosphotransferase (APT) family kinase protein
VPRTADLVDPAALASWADGVLEGDGPLTATPLGAGHSNLTYRIARGDRAWVLRRPPAGPLLPTAHDVLREHRVLRLLAAQSAVRAPRPVAACADAAVIGAPFYVMDLVEGVVVRADLPRHLAGDRPAQRALGLDLVDALAEIHLARWQPFVDAGVGRPTGYLARQMRRWTGQREGIEVAVAAGGGTARALPGYVEVRDWLAAHLPAEVEPAVVHGDFKLDNVIVGPGADPRVAAVVDWEMATVGDPRADLGYLLAMWPQPGEQPALGDVVAAAPGFPSRDELTQRWASATGRDPGDSRWFVALAIWKLAILLEASYHRWLAGTSEDPFFGTLETGVPKLLARAREVCGA